MKRFIASCLLFAVALFAAWQGTGPVQVIGILMTIIFAFAALACLDGIRD